MLKILMIRFRRRRAVSSMIGGLIILSLLLTALGTMVFVSQRYDQYQQTVTAMALFHNQQLSENLVANFPGLTGPTSVSGCGGTCNQYNMSLSNLGGVGVQIARIYINSTGSGCINPIPGLCMLNPASTITSYAFQRSNQFLNPGETNHFVLIWLPSTVTLPNPTTSTPENTILIVTTRGRVFSFQWPFAAVGAAQGGQSGASVTTGVMKIAYQGFYDSKNDFQGAPGSTYPIAPYCHGETSQPYPAGPGYAETLPGITGVTGGSLTFVNPWTIDQILGLVLATGGATVSLYIYANILNPANHAAIQISNGALLLNAAGAGANAKAWFLGGSLFGVYYQGAFTQAGTLVTIQPGQSYYAIYVVNQVNLTQLSGPVFFVGFASVSNNEKLGAAAGTNAYFSAEVLLDGLYDRGTC